MLLTEVLQPWGYILRYQWSRIFLQSIPSSFSGSFVFPQEGVVDHSLSWEDKRPWKRGCKAFLVFTWRHSGHVGAPKQRNGSHLGVPDWSLGKKWQRTPNNSFNQVRNWLTDLTNQTNQKQFSESQAKETGWSEQKRSLIVKLTVQFEN